MGSSGDQGFEFGCVGVLGFQSVVEGQTGSEEDFGGRVSSHSVS